MSIGYQPIATTYGPPPGPTLSRPSATAAPNSFYRSASVKGIQPFSPRNAPAQNSPRMANRRTNGSVSFAMGNGHSAPSSSVSVPGGNSRGQSGLFKTQSLGPQGHVQRRVTGEPAHLQAGKRNNEVATRGCSLQVSAGGSFQVASALPRGSQSFNLQTQPSMGHAGSVKLQIGSGFPGQRPGGVPFLPGTVHNDQYNRSQTPSTRGSRFERRAGSPVPPMRPSQSSFAGGRSQSPLVRRDSVFVPGHGQGYSQAMSSVPEVPGFQRCQTNARPVAQTSDMLDKMILPGDVLVAFETGRLWDIGRAGGFMGHVLLVSSVPRLIPLYSLAPIETEALFPPDACDDEICMLPAEVWAIETVESTRGSEGLHKASMLVYVDSAGRLTLIGEEGPYGLSCQDHEVLELWQSPNELRWQLRQDLMSQAFVDMEYDIGDFDWSANTAARAVFNSASISYAREAEVAACWQQKPICTSVVISLWQRYLSKVAQAHNATPTNARLNVMELFQRYMPLKADRGLPGELLAAMREAGWTSMANMRQGTAGFAMSTVPRTATFSQPTNMVPQTNGHFSPAPPRFTPVAAAPTTQSMRHPMQPVPGSPVVQLAPQGSFRIGPASGGQFVHQPAKGVDRNSVGYVERQRAKAVALGYPAQVPKGGGKGGYPAQAPRPMQAPMRPGAIV